MQAWVLGWAPTMEGNCSAARKQRFCLQKMFQKANKPGYSLHEPLPLIVKFLLFIGPILSF